MKSIVLALASLALLLAIGGLSTQQVYEVYDGVSGRNGPLDIFSTDTPYPLLRCLAGFALGVVSYRLSHVSWLSWTRRIAYSGDVIMAAVLLCLLIPNTDVLVVLEFNWSSQHPCGPTVSTRQTPRQASSNRGSCEVCC